MSLDAFGIRPGARTAIDRQPVVAHLIECDVRCGVDAMLFGELDEHARFTAEIDAGQPFVLAQNPRPLEVMARLDHAAVRFWRTTQIVVEELTQRVAIEETRAEEPDELARLIQKPRLP